MKKISCFIMVNVAIITVINTLISVLSRVISIELIYKYPLIELVTLIIIPLYLIINENIFFSKNDIKSLLRNSRYIFLIIFTSNFFTYLIDQFIIDKIFNVMPDLDNIILFIIFTMVQFLVIPFFILAYSLFIIKIKKF